MGQKIDLAMKKVKIWGMASDSQLTEVANSMRNGEIIIYPTDTLYAIGCDMNSKHGLDKLYRAKGMIEGNTPLSLICSDISMASEYVHIDNRLFRLLKNNTPGPFTFIIKCGPRLPKQLRERKELGIRIPDNPTARALAKTLGNPILSASLDYDDELAGDDPEIAAMPYEHIVDLLLVEDNLATIPTTIVDCRDGSADILRQGLGNLETE